MKAIRQSVSIPAPLVREVRRVAKERHLTISRALVTLAERGVRAELDAKENLKIAYRAFLKEQDPSRKEEAGREMIRAIFGRDASLISSQFVDERKIPLADGSEK